MNKKLIRLTESDLHRIVRESVNKVLNEIGDTEKGQYALGCVQARGDLKARQNYDYRHGNQGGHKYFDMSWEDNYRPEAGDRFRQTSDDAEKTAYKYNDGNKDLYLANQRGYMNYLKYMSSAGNEDYRTAPQTKQEVQAAEDKYLRDQWGLNSKQPQTQS